MVNSRTKGATWERDLAKKLFLELGIKFSRNLEQYRAAEEADLIPDNDNFPFSIEAKHYSKGRGCKPKWWMQATTAAQQSQKFPCVIYKYNRYEPKAVISLKAIEKLYGTNNNQNNSSEDIKLELSIEDFCYVCRELMSLEDMIVHL